MTLLKPICFGLVAACFAMMGCSSSGSSTSSGCGGLLSCCSMLSGAEAQACNTTASTNGVTDAECSQALAGYQSTGSCGGSGAGAMGCTALTACCPKLPASQVPTECDAVASTGTAMACQTSLSTYQAAGYCVADAGTTAAETVQQFCTQKAQAECQYVVPVCASLSMSACIAFRSNLCNQDASTATASGSRSFAPSSVAACLSAISETYGTLNPSTNTTLSYASISGGPTDTTSVDYLCDSVFQGKVPTNGTCTSSFDCADGNVCTPANGGSTVTVCATLNQVADGAPCGVAGDVCVSGDVCTRNSNGEYLCEANEVSLGGPGAVCTSDAQCDPTTAGFCDIYAMTGCQPGYMFGDGKDCEAYGLTSGS